MVGKRTAAEKREDSNEGIVMRAIVDRNANGHSQQESLSARKQVLRELIHNFLSELEELKGVNLLSLLDDTINFHEARRRFEIILISEALKVAGGNRARAAALLNLKRKTLNSKIKQYNIFVDSQAGNTTES